MSRIGVLLVFALCSAFLASMPTPPASAAGQEAPPCTVTDPDPDLIVLWDCVERPVPIPDAYMPEEGFTTIGGKRFQAYRVEFRALNAGVPNIPPTDDVPETEFMIVTVLEGDFVLENNAARERSFIVDPRDEHPVDVVKRENLDPSIDLRERVYVDTGDTLTVGGTDAPCVDMCVVPRGIAVRVTVGDTVYALQGALCIWCLQNSRAEHEASNTGVLQVAALVEPDGFPDSFSWIRDWETRQGQPMATTSSSQTMMAWAFGPKAACAGG